MLKTSVRLGFWLVWTGALWAQGDLRRLGENVGYDAQHLTNHLHHSPHRLLLDLAGTWDVVYDGFKETARVPAAYIYSGKVVYRRTFTPSAEFARHHFRLRAWGINFGAEIRINDEFIVNYQGGFLQRQIDLRDDLIRIGEPNTIEITVNSEVTHEQSIPRSTTTLVPRHYGGIFREIFLEAIPQITIDRYTVDYTISNDLRRVDIQMGLHFRDYQAAFAARDTSVSGAVVEQQNSYRYLIEVFDEENPDPVYSNKFKRYRNPWEIPKIRELNPESQFVMSHFTDVETRFQIEKPTFWNPENPYRYRVVVTLLKQDSTLDEIQFHLGLVKVEIQDNNILLNSQLLIIRGIEYYEDYPGAGNAVPYDVMEADILRMKKVGVNVVHFKHHPPHPYFVELCNRYGLFILCEAPFSALPVRAAADNRYREDMKAYYRQMVESYRNEVSIFAWSVGHAYDLSANASFQLVTDMIDNIRLVDNRPILYSSRFGSLDRIPDRVDLINLELWNNDFVAANVFTARSMARWPNRAVICTYGPQVYPNNQNGYSDPSSTKFQAKYLVDIFRKLGEWKMAGGIVRSYNDFSVNRTYIFGYPTDQSVYTSGIVTVLRKERYAYDFVRAMYTGDKIETIPIGSYENSFPKTFPIVGLLLVLIFIVFFRQSPKFSNSVFRSITKILSFFSDVRENRVINLWPALIVGFLASLTMSGVLALIFFELRRNQLFDQVLANVVVVEAIKDWLDHLAWNPEWFVISFTLLFMAMLFGMAILYRLFAVAYRSVLPFQQALIASLWSSAHFLLLIPFLIVFQRLIRIDVFMTMLLIVTAVMVLWHVARFFRIAKILYDISWIRTGFIMGGLTMLVAMFIMYRYSSRHDFFDMMEYVNRIEESQNYSSQ